METIIGIDAHHKTCTYVVKDRTGLRLDEGTIPSTPKALTALSLKHPGAHAVIEASSVHHWIYDHLLEHGIQVHACHPANIKQLLGKKKDELDAAFLADAFLLNVLPPSWVPPQETRDLRQLVRHRANLIHDRTRLINRIHGTLKHRGIPYRETTDVVETKNIMTKPARKQLEALQDPNVSSLLRLVDSLEEELKILGKAVEKAANEREGTRRLMSIPGVGPTVALTVYAELGDITRFTDADQVAAYFGLTPSLSQSGETTTHGHITKRGSDLARWMLGQAAWQHAMRAPQSSLTKSYTHLKARRGHRIAIVALARKLAKLSYHLLRENRDFRITG